MARFSGSRLLTLLRSKEDARILYSYPGASAAFSLRALAVGDPTVVRVRRSSDNAEANFTAREVNDGTLVAWVGTTASDDGHVVTWFDQSGNNNDVTQATAADQPLIVDAGVLVTENGKAAISFDGVNHLLRSNSAKQLVSTSDGAFSAFGIAKYPALGNAYLLGNDDNDRIAQMLRIDSLSNSLRAIVFTGAGGSTTFVEAFSPISSSFVNQQVLQSTIMTGSTLTVYANSNAGNVESVSNPKTGTGFIGVGSRGTTGAGAAVVIQEAVVYSSEQSANRVAIEQNIANYYGITLA